MERLNKTYKINNMSLILHDQEVNTNLLCLTLAIEETYERGKSRWKKGPKSQFHNLHTTQSIASDF